MGRRSDPFFADLDGNLKKIFQWTGIDTMANMNIFSIVLEMPNAELGTNALIGVWARISIHRDGQLVSIDRGAHPSVTAYFNETNEAKDAYNLGEPVNDWGHLSCTVDCGSCPYRPLQRGGRREDLAHDLAGYSSIRPQQNRQPIRNGRTLTDDVTSARLAMVLER